MDIVQMALDHHYHRSDLTRDMPRPRVDEPFEDEYYCFNASSSILILRHERDNLKEYLLKIKQSAFQASLYDADCVEILKNYIHSTRHHWLVKLLEADDPYLREMVHRMKEKSAKSQDDDSALRKLHNFGEFRFESDLNHVLDTVKKTMSDRARFTKRRAGYVRAFTAENALRYIDNIGQDSERLERAWHMLKAMSVNNGFRTRLSLSNSIWNELIDLKVRFPNFNRVTEHVLAQLQLQPLKRDDCRRIKPILLNGPRGTGKTAYAKALAKALNTGFAYVNMGTISMGGELLGTTQKWSNGQHGQIVQALAKGKTASPVVMLDEVDKCSTSPYFSIEGSLLSILEPETSRDLYDEFGRLQFDGSFIIYVGTSNDSNQLSAPLRSRFDEFQIPYPDRKQRQMIITNMLKKDYEMVTLSPRALMLIARQDVDLRALRSLLDKVLYQHLRARIAEIVEPDVKRHLDALCEAQVIEEHTVRVTLNAMGFRPKVFDDDEM